MLSTEQCLAKARGLTDRTPLSPEIAAELLEMAEQWLDLARVAEWQDQPAVQGALEAARR